MSIWRVLWFMSFNVIKRLLSTPLKNLPKDDVVDCSKLGADTCWGRSPPSSNLDLWRYYKYQNKYICIYTQLVRILNKFGTLCIVLFQEANVHEAMILCDQLTKIFSLVHDLMGKESFGPRKKHQVVGRMRLAALEPGTQKVWSGAWKKDKFHSLIFLWMGV